MPEPAPVISATLPLSVIVESPIAEREFQPATTLTRGEEREIEITVKPASRIEGKIRMPEFPEGVIVTHSTVRLGPTKTFSRGVGGQPE